ncbi:MAG: adenylate/guanylate cyclase domain-containing protein [Pseudomonadota bacterium]
MTALDAGFAREDRANFTYMLKGRVLVLTLLAAWVVLTLPFERSAAYLSVLLIFLLTGVIPYLLVARGYAGTLLIATFLLLDAIMLSYLLIVPNPYGLEGWSPQLNLRAPGFLYLGLFVVYMALSYRPALVVWAGVAAIASWTAGYVWVVSLPDTRFFASRDVLNAGLALQAVLERVLDPNAVGLARIVNQVVFLMAVTLILTLAVSRSRKLVRRQVEAEGQRSALSRYFSPNIVQELTTTGHAFGEPKLQPVAVLFADMVGFTAIAERLGPVELVGLLREFHGRLARVALREGGTVDKYIGDAIMIHFGTPEPRHDDAVRALRCAAGMITAIKTWNNSRAAEGLEPIHLGIGVHCGDVVVGNIGDAQRLEYTVLGDAVNVASRLEQLTRTLGVILVTSDAVIDAVRQTGTEPEMLLPGLVPQGTEAVKGRADPVRIWALQGWA